MDVDFDGLRRSGWSLGTGASAQIGIRRSLLGREVRRESRSDDGRAANPCGHGKGSDGVVAAFDAAVVEIYR